MEEITQIFAEEEAKVPWRPEAFCQKTHAECNHPCCGHANESTCLPCLERGCDKVKFEQYADTLCSICQTETLGEGPCALFEC